MYNGQIGSLCEQGNMTENITFQQLHWWVVKMADLPTLPNLYDFQRTRMICKSQASIAQLVEPDLTM